jgi:anti-sigma factor RsiW
VISCEEAIRELWSYLSDEIAPADRGRVAEHLDACRRCCGELEFLGELRRFVAVAGDHLPADVEVRMEAFLVSLDRSTPEGPDDRPDAQG